MNIVKDESTRFVKLHALLPTSQFIYLMDIYIVVEHTDKGTDVFNTACMMNDRLTSDFKVTPINITEIKYKEV